jgi:hypothetical protein
VDDVAEKMTKADRDALIRIAKARARQARQEADQRAKVLLAEVEDLMAAEFEARDEMWADAVTIAEEAALKANEQIVARCAELGIPAKHAPKLQMAWSARSSSFRDPDRRGELRKVAQSRVNALTATAKTMVDAKVLETEERLVLGGLETGEAKAFIESMPTVEQLMPALSLDDLGVKHWQPPDDAAAVLLTPSTTADRKRRKVLRAIEANPGASNRAIAEIAGVDHKTVGKYRTEAGESVGEIPSGFPDDGDGGGRRG